MKSISSKLFFILLIFSSFILILLSYFIYNSTQKFLFESQKNNLNSKMELLIGNLHKEKNEVEFDFSELYTGEYSIPASGYYFIVKINEDNYEKLISSSSVLENSFNFNESKIIEKGNNYLLYETIDIKNNKILVLKKEFYLFDKKIELQIGESIEKNRKIIEKLNNSIYIFNSIAIIILFLINYLVIKKILNPLNIFTKEISNISSENLKKHISIPSNDLEIISLTNSFNKMLLSINKAFETERFIISEVSHQLKTPLSIIKTTTEVTLKKERKIEDYKEALLDINDTSIDMSKKINDILTIAKLNSESIKEVKFKEIYINDIIEKSISILDVLSNKKNIRIIFDNIISYKIRGDFDMLIEAFTNIIENSIKYSRDNSKIDIDIKLKNENIFISIKDYGIGIKNEDLSKIFNHFFRSQNNVEAGTGLGLPIVELIIKQHNGKIYVESKENWGTIFSISIPLLV